MARPAWRGRTWLQAHHRQAGERGGIAIDQGAWGRQGIEAARGGRTEGLQLLHPPAPAAPVGPVDPVGIAGAGGQALRLHQQLVPAGQHLAPIGLQRSRHPPVALAPIGLHIPVPGHHLRLQSRGHARQQLLRIPLQDQQPAAGGPPALGQLPQALPQKPQPCRCHGRQLARDGRRGARLKDRRIQHEHPGERRGGAGGGGQAEVVGQAQVAAVPEQPAGWGHGLRWLLVRSQAVAWPAARRSRSCRRGIHRRWPGLHPIRPAPSAAPPGPRRHRRRGAALGG